MTVLESIKAKLKEQYEKSERIHTLSGKGQMPSTRGGTGNIETGVGQYRTDKAPDRAGATSEHASNGARGHFGSIKHDQEGQSQSQTS